MNTVQSKVNVEFILLIVCAVLIQGCSQINQVKDVKDGPGRELDVSSIPDAIPRMEPITVAGNKNPYTVFGKTYHLLPSAEKYRQVGIASWYGSHRETIHNLKNSLSKLSGSLPLLIRD